MDLREYQRLAMTSAAKGKDSPLTFIKTGEPVTAEFAALGLAGEAGEIGNLLKKTWRNNGTTGGPIERIEQIKEEMGDALWYLAQLAEITGISLEEVAAGNLRKLGII